MRDISDPAFIQASLLAALVSNAQSSCTSSSDTSSSVSDKKADPDRKKAVELGQMVGTMSQPQIAAARAICGSRPYEINVGLTSPTFKLTCPELTDEETRAIAALFSADWSVTINGRDARLV